MPTLHLLGTGAAVTDAHRTTTMLAVTDGASTLAIDCGGDLVQRLTAAGLGLETLDALVITHEHPDHVAGFPLFMEKIWLAGRTRPIPVYGIGPAIAQAQRCLHAFNIEHWDLPEIQWHEVAHEEGAAVLDDDRWQIKSTPGIHSVPVAGLRIAHKPSGKVIGYSADTEASGAIACLAYGADVLVHEATGAGPGHASIEDAGRVAASAEVGRLLLVHLPPGLTDADLADARAHFSPVALGEELGAYPL